MITARASTFELAHISKRYDAVAALDDVGLLIRPGTIHALLGENGAGKTTLVRIAYGMSRPDAGRMLVGTRDVHFTSPMDAIAAGIGMVHQHFTLVPAMTVAENLSLGGSGRLRSSEMNARVRAVAKRTGFTLEPDVRVETLPIGAQQRVEIAKALARNASVLILDEPTAVLAPAEIVDLLRWLRTYVTAGCSAVLITHKLHEALAVADDVTVLRRGRVVYSGPANGVTPDALTTAMIGAVDAVELETRHGKGPHSAIAVAPIIRASSISVLDDAGRVCIRNASFVVRPGELVGLAAVEGAGHRELLRALAGRLRISAGRLERPSRIGFVPEDRHHDAVLLDRSLAENVALRGAGGRRGLIDWSTLHNRTTTLTQEYDIRATGTRDPMRTLSGGNQQKLVLARELASIPDEPAPDVLVVENPTRGLDVRAAAGIHTRLRDACGRGAAVLVYSSDLDEVLALAVRVLVIFNGTVREMPLDREAIGRGMLGLA